LRIGRAAALVHEALVHEALVHQAQVSESVALVTDES
jgi:hypothetical protein